MYVCVFMFVQRACDVPLLVFLGFSGISRQWKVGYLKFLLLINHLFKEHVSVFTSIQDFL